MKKQANPRSESPDRGTPFQLTNRPAESVSPPVPTGSGTPSTMT